MNQLKYTFFDDQKSGIWVKGHVNTDENAISGLMRRMSKKGTLKEGLYCICNDRLVYKEKFIILSNITLESKGSSIFLTRNMRQLEFMCPNEESARLWFDKIKQFAIQRNFKDKYTMIKMIGKGNFAKVYSASRKTDQQVFAIKAFDKLKFADIKVDKPALIKELSIMRLMDLRGVIKLFEVFENESYVFLVCELLEGGELFTHMKGNKGYDEKTVANVMYRILQSIAYIHANGVLHRDIKPENLILRNKTDIHDVVIADFGLADYYQGDGDYMFKRCGTPGYVAPEVLQDKIYDYKVDVFSAGVLMFIMLSGQSPFKADSYDEIVMKNYHCQVDFNLLVPKAVSVEAFALLHELLEANPIRRITAEQALQHDWFNIKADQQLFLDGIYPRFNRNPDLYAKTPLMGQELNLSLSSTPQSVTPQMRSKSNTADVMMTSPLSKTPNSKTPNQLQKFQSSQQSQPVIAEENDFNVNEEDDHPQGQCIKMYQIQPKMKKSMHDQDYNIKGANKVRDHLQKL